MVEGILFVEMHLLNAQILAQKFKKKALIFYKKF